MYAEFHDRGILHDGSPQIRFFTMNTTRLLLLGFVLCFGPRTIAQTPSADAIKQLADDYFARRPSQTLHAGLSLMEARAAQKEFVSRLKPKLGPAIGFKVGLTSKAVQESVGATAPMRGVLLRDMMLKDSAKV